MRGFRIFIIVLLGWSLLTWPHPVAAGKMNPASRILLPQKLMAELNQILNTSEGLHQSFVNRDEDQIEINIREVINQIKHTERLSVLAKEHERGHLLRILNSACGSLELVQGSYGDERMERLQDVFDQLANIVRIYRVDSLYNIFFCGRDRSTWVQKGRKPASPFKPEASHECLRVVD